MGPQAWPTVERRSEVDAIRAAVNGHSDCRGVLLLGDAGVGKTTLARSVAAPLGQRALWLAGAESAREIPLGLFAFMLAGTRTSDPIALLSQACAEVRRRGLAVIGVDDIHLVDHLSATLLHQLTVEGSVRVVATARSAEPIPATITSLWKDGYLRRLDIGPFTREEVVGLVETALDGHLEDLSAETIWQASGGNGLYVRHLVEGARDAGSLRLVDGVWQLRGDVLVTAELAVLVAERVDLLDADEMRALQILAMGRPLPAEVLGLLAGSDALERLERRGLIIVADELGCRRVDFAHPLIGEAIRGRTGHLATRRLSAELLAALNDHIPLTSTDRIRRAELALAAGGNVDGELLMRAAHDAIAVMDLQTAELLARAAADRAPGFRSSEVVARSLLLQGRSRDAEEVLAPFNPESLGEFELAQWGISRVANLRWAIGDAAAAEPILALLERRLIHPALRSVLDGLRAALLVLDGSINESAALAEQVLADPAAPPVAIGWAVFGGVMSAALAGRPADAVRLAERGREVSARVDALMRFLLALGEVRALTLAGDFDTAAARSGDLVRITSPSQFRARAMAQILSATVEVGRGHLATATTRLEESLAALHDEAGAAWALPARLLLAQCYCALGMTAQARPLVVELEVAAGPGGRSFGPSMLITRAWLAAAEGHLSGATATAVEAADLAAAANQHGIELMALHAAARFGDRTCLSRLADVAEAVGGPLAAADAAHARGLIVADGAAVFAAAAEFERIGALLSAADTAAQAAALFERAGDRRHALEAAATADRLSSMCGGLRTPAICAQSQPLPLSAREREIAELAAHGVSNREIAERLVLSRRTVESHLYRIFAKLDVTDREALGSVMRGR